jgi:hypothetical protein
MKWVDNLLLEGEDEEALRERGQLQLAMYAIHLGSGHTIYCKQIRVSTIEAYIYAVATFLQAFTRRDYRKDKEEDRHLGQQISPVLRDLKKYESMPNRREAYNLVMQQLAVELAQGTPPNGIVAALTDHFAQGLCTGFRLSEWAQPNGSQQLMTHQLNHLKPPATRTRAIVPDDFQCETKRRKRAKGIDILGFTLKSITKLWLTYRTQKNRQNGEIKLHTPNSDPEGVCMVASTYSALKRFKRLQALDARISPATTPLAIYLDGSVVKHIVSKDIEQFMRRLAMEVYNLHPVKDADELSKWGTHSLRVGACVILHAMGFSFVDIQFILRWRSMAFVSYLRNVAILSERQNRAFNRAGAMPHLVS